MEIYPVISPHSKPNAIVLWISYSLCYPYCVPLCYYFWKYFSPICSLILPSKSKIPSPEIHVFIIHYHLAGMPIFFFLYRLGITIFQSLFDLNVKSTYTILVLLHLIFGLIMMYDSLNNFPYHNKNVSKAQGIFASAYLWINATFLLL